MALLELLTYNDEFLIDDAGEFILSTDGDSECCCPVEGCCDRLEPPGATPEHLPTTFTLTITDVADCGCVDGLMITLTWDAIAQAWKGTGPGGGACALLSEEWTLDCSTAEGGGTSWILAMAQVTSCIQTPLPALANAGFTCNPVRLEFDIHVDGIGCCDGAMSGSGDIHVVVEE